MNTKKPEANNSKTKQSTTISSMGSLDLQGDPSTVSGPSREASKVSSGDKVSQKKNDTQTLVSGMPFNPTKPDEYGSSAAIPKIGATFPLPSPDVTSSTLTEKQPSQKTGAGQPSLGYNPTHLPLDRVRTDSTDRVLTTNQAVPVGDNQHSLKVDLRGPALLEDFILREKITHFDHERIPERVVHARGSGAHGYFECYGPMTHVTRAALFSEKGLKTPVFVRFSTVIGERGSPDTARDVRGFAVKFYTSEGNWDLVGNNMPVFFIQDAMKFPDLVHAAKPEPHFAMPQASTAHDTFWDFVSLMPESTHMLMWLMSDRALPRSYRMMEGFGVHTFRLLNNEGDSTFVKFHWRPLAGIHSLDWDEAVKLQGADPDFHRRDLWEAIESGNFPEWELCFQSFTEKQAESFSFDILDSTKLIPVELVPLTPVGRMVLTRNPDNFFAETEQVAFCAAHVVPGIDFSNDPLLAGRIHSYLDTQISRLGGPNFHEIPINGPVAQVHNNQRDGMHRQIINRGRVAYEPNSLGGGCPFQAGASGFRSYGEQVEAHKIRGKPELFAEHYSQATLFYNSQSPVEKAHILRAYRFELTRVQVPAIRQRVVAMLANVDFELAETLAGELGMNMPDPLPKSMSRLNNAPAPELDIAPSLSLLSHPGDGNIRSRRIAILVADGVDGEAAQRLHNGLTQEGAGPRYIGARLGNVITNNGEQLKVEGTFETLPSVLFDAVAVVGGQKAVQAMCQWSQAIEFIKDQYRHGKTILALGEGATLVEHAGALSLLSTGQKDPGILMEQDAPPTEALALFIKAIGKHRHHHREIWPPQITT